VHEFLSAFGGLSLACVNAAITWFSDSVLPHCSMASEFLNSARIHFIFFRFKAFSSEADAVLRD
jgi:hypothetical protein